MAHIQYIIGNERIIDIADRYDDITAVLHLRSVKVQCILYLGEQNARKLLFYNMIGRLLQIGVQRKIDIISCLRVFSLDRFYHLADTVDIELHLSLFPLELLIQRLFKTGLADRILLGILFLLFFAERVIIFLGYLSRVSDDRCKALTVCIPAQRLFLNVDPLQGIQILHDDSHGLITYILGDRGSYELLEAVQGDGIPYIDKLQHRLLVHLLLIDAITVQLVRAEVVDNILCRAALLLVTELVYRLFAVHIGDKAETLRVIFSHKLIIAVTVQNNAEVIDHCITVGLYDIDHRIDDLIDLFVLVS